MPGSNAWNGWERQFLSMIGAPVTRNNVLFLQAWQAGEQSGARYNPLNTTRTGYAGSYNFNRVGVKNYVSAKQGLQANADALVKTGYYNDIVSALRAGNISPSRLAALVVASPWGTKHFPSLGNIAAAQDPQSAQSQDTQQAEQALTSVDTAASAHPRYDAAKRMDEVYQALINPTLVDHGADTSDALAGVERAGPLTSAFVSRINRPQQPDRPLTGFPTRPDLNPLNPNNSGLPISQVPAVTDPGGSTKPIVTNVTGVLANIMKVANSALGKPYVWGGESLKEGGFDCSGLIDYAYRQAGVKLPVGRLTTYNALKLGISVKGKTLQPGDMVVVNKGEHMVMYVGGGKVIAAPHRGTVVQYQPLSAFKGSIVDIRRLIVVRKRRK